MHLAQPATPSSMSTLITVRSSSTSHLQVIPPFPFGRGKSRENPNEFQMPRKAKSAKQSLYILKLMLTSETTASTSSATINFTTNPYLHQTYTTYSLLANMLYYVCLFVCLFGHCSTYTSRRSPIPRNFL